ncbi:hypothetical protein DPMN_165054 [Dreissena polymorpha]|uniref:Uncharacterized protein n=1 Tax=Dreissena polymorpha TaxID=45954 RepID=A0A9D4ISW4_DREPO|nr:hypothetical protein DPMN_165054 [Dreissena polymorpha]
MSLQKARVMQKSCAFLSLNARTASRVFSALLKVPKKKLFQKALLQPFEYEVHEEAEERLLHGPLPTQADHPPQDQTETWLRAHTSTQLHYLFQMLVYISHSGLTRIPLHMMLGHAIYERDRIRSLLKAFNRIGACSSYLTIRSARKDGETPIPSTFTKEDYIMAGMDNSDYADKSPISGTEGLHYAALVVFQDATVNRPLSKPPVFKTVISRAHPILKTKLPCQEVPPHIKPTVRPALSQDIVLHPETKQATLLDTQTARNGKLLRGSGLDDALIEGGTVLNGSHYVRTLTGMLMLFEHIRTRLHIQSWRSIGKNAVVSDRLYRRFSIVLQRVSKDPGGHYVVEETRNAGAVAEFELLFHEIGSITSLLNLLTTNKPIDHTECHLQHSLSATRQNSFNHNVEMLLDYVLERQNPYTVTVNVPVPLHNLLTKLAVEKAKKISSTISKRKLPKLTDHLKQSLLTSKAILKERKSPSSNDIADAQRSMDIAKERGMTLMQILSYDLISSSPLFDDDLPAHVNKSQLIGEIESRLDISKCTLPAIKFGNEVIPELLNWIEEADAKKCRMLPLHQAIFRLGTLLAKTMIKAHILTGEDCMSKVGTKHAAVTSDPVQFLMNFGETDTLSEQNEALAEKYLVRVWAGARSPTTAETFDHLRLENYTSASAGLYCLPPTSKAGIFGLTYSAATAPGPCGEFSHFRRKCPPTGGHVFQATGTTFDLVQNIIGTNLLTKFHDDHIKGKMPRPLGGHVFPPIGTMFELIEDIIGKNHLTKFHNDRTINVASREKCSAPDIIRTKLLTKFHEDRKINVASRVLTRNNAPPPGSHFFLTTSIIFELIQDIFGVNLLTKFHEDRTINVASREKCPALGSHDFQANVTIFDLIQDIIETNLLTKLHEDWTLNVASRVFTRSNVTIFEFIQDIIVTNLPIKVHEDWTINVASRLLTRKTAPPPDGHVFSPIWTIFELVRDINETNVLTKFHDDWAKIVTSRVFTRNTAPPPGGHLHEHWASNVTSTVFTSFELSRGINGTNVLTNFMKIRQQMWPLEFSQGKMLTTDDARRTKSDNKSSP